MSSVILDLIAAGSVAFLIYAVEYDIMRKGLKLADDNWESNTGLKSPETQESIDRKSQMVAISVAVVCGSYFYYYVSAILVVGGIVALVVVYMSIAMSYKIIQ